MKDMNREWKTLKEYEDILFEFYNGIARITINRPQVRNAFRNFYKAIMQRLKTHEFGLRATSRIKTFVFKFISVPAKWIKTSRRHVLNIYSDNNAYANLFKTDFG